MKLYIKNKVMSIGGGSIVYNESKEVEYYVKGRPFSITRVKQILNKDKVKLYKVRNKFWNFLTRSAFIYDSSGNNICKMTRKISLKGVFEVCGSQDEYMIEGNVIGFNYKIFKNGEIIGTIKRELTWVVDAFELDCEENADVPFLLAFIIALDNICDK